MRYSSATESKLGEDFNKMDAIAKGTMPNYQSTELTIDTKTIQETWFSAGNAYCKAVLCLLAYQQPKSFDTNGMVILDNSNLKIATSRNDHHFFPRQYLASASPNKESNLIANITLIDGYSNKHRIGKKAPSEYIDKFAKDNESLPETLQTHLIKDIDAYGVHTDDYDRFIARQSDCPGIERKTDVHDVGSGCGGGKGSKPTMNLWRDPHFQFTPLSAIRGLGSAFATY